MMTFIPDVSILSDEELLSYSIKLARHETEVGLQIIACLREAEKRMLYSQLGLSSLWEYATQHLGLSNGNAQMKIDAMRLVRDNPIAQQKIETGELSISNAAKVNSFFRHEKKAGHAYTSEEKTEVIESVLGLSQSKCERTLLARAPDSIPHEKIRPLTETKTELKIVVDEKTLAVLERLKELLSHKMPNATYAELLDYLAREKVEEWERKKMGATLEEARSQPEEFTPPTGVKNNSGFSTPRAYISVEDRRWVMRRAQGQCERVTEEGRRCTSRHQLEIDHLTPLALGGTHDRSNLRVVCKACNLYSAKMALGEAVMSRYVSSMK